MPGQRFEIAIGMQNRSVRPNGNSSDQAIDESANSLAVATAYPVEERGLIVVFGNDLYERRSRKETAKLPKMLFVTGTSEYLHADATVRSASGEGTEVEITLPVGRRGEVT